MYFIFYIFRGLKLPALTKVVTTTSLRLRSTGRKKQRGEDGMAVPKPAEDIKPLIICKKGPLDGTPEKLFVDVEHYHLGQQVLKSSRQLGEGNHLHQDIYMGGVGLGLCVGV